MSVSVSIDGTMTRNGKYLSDNESLIADLLERAGLTGAYVVKLTRQLPSHGGTHQGLAAVKIKVASGAHGRRVAIITQVSGNDSCYEFTFGCPRSIKNTSELVEKLENARDDLIRETETPRAAEAARRIIQEIGGSKDCLTALSLLPEAMVKTAEGEYRILRSVFQLIDDDQQDQLIRVCREVAILLVCIGKGTGGGDVYSFDRRLHRRVIAELIASGYLEEPKECAPETTTFVQSVVKQRSELDDAEDLFKDAEQRRQEAYQRRDEIQDRIDQRSNPLQRAKWQLDHLFALFEVESDKAQDLHKKVSEIKADIEELERKLQDVVSQRTSQLEVVQRAKEVAIKQKGVCNELNQEQETDQDQLERALKNIEACEADILFAQNQIEELKKRPVQDLVEATKSKRLTREQTLELMRLLQETIEDVP